MTRRKRGCGLSAKTDREEKARLRMEKELARMETMLAYEHESPETL